MATESSRVTAFLERSDFPAVTAVGAVVTVGLSFLPFSPLAGGAVAAVRYGRGYLAGFLVGVASGVFAAVPLGVLFGIALVLVSLLGVGIAPGEPGYGLFVAVATALFLSYTVGLSALGGLVGIVLDRHTRLSVDPATWM